jgi:hypothetical protein
MARLARQQGSTLGVHQLAQAHGYTVRLWVSRGSRGLRHFCVQIDILYDFFLGLRDASLNLFRLIGRNDSLRDYFSTTDPTALISSWRE